VGGGGAAMHKDAEVVYFLMRVRVEG